MIRIHIPGWGDLNIENIVFDFNGTIATDGKIPIEVKEKINLLSNEGNVFVLTADTQETTQEEVKEMNINLITVEYDSSGKGKFEFIKNFNLENTVAIGNGNNDLLILKEAALGIAVIGDEGLSASAMKNADIIVKDVSEAIDLFLKPKRLIATLRE